MNGVNFKGLYDIDGNFLKKNPYLCREGTKQS